MYFIVDIEATCFEKPRTPDLNEIIDIAVIVCDDNFCIVNSWHSLVKPIINRKLSRFCCKLTGIQQKDVDQAKTLSEVMLEFQYWFEPLYDTNSSSVNWYTWGDWDEKTLFKDCIRHNLNFPFGKHLNLRNIYVQRRNNGHNNKCNLHEVVHRENLNKIEKWHRAYDDAMAAAEIARLIFNL